jgi:DNA-binding NtrC family response regulator
MPRKGPDEAMRMRIISALKIAKGDVGEAARILEMGRTTLYRKIAELGLRDQLELIRFELNRPSRKGKRRRCS